MTSDQNTEVPHEGAPSPPKAKPQPIVDLPSLRDYTKTALYAWTDLGAKLLSAIALVVLGLIGWHLQSRAQDANEAAEKLAEAAEKLDRQQRKYLPMLRSLLELEMVLDDAIADLRTGAPASDSASQSSSDNANRALGDKLRNTAYQVFVPDGDPMVGIRLQTPFGGGRASGNELRVPLRASALMLSDILRAQTELHKGTVRLDIDVRAIQIRDGQTTTNFYVTGDSLPAWRALLGDRQERSFHLRAHRCLIIAQDLRFGIGQVVRDTLVQNPELGDRYVTIRNDFDANSRAQVSQ